MRASSSCSSRLYNSRASRPGQQIRTAWLSVCIFPNSEQLGSYIVSLYCIPQCCGCAAKLAGPVWS
jgi:hypothetical protein